MSGFGDHPASAPAFIQTRAPAPAIPFLLCSRSSSSGSDSTAFFFLPSLQVALSAGAVVRYKSGSSLAEHCEAQRGKRQSVAGGGQWGPPWTQEDLAKLAPATRAIVGGAFDVHEARAAL